MFAVAASFNQPIGEWEVSHVTDMSFMFGYADKFNQPIGGWNVSNVLDISEMFFSAELFNQPIGEWNVSKVTLMQSMFNYAESFNQPIGDWDVSKVINMHSMFKDAKSFNRPLGTWNISGVKYMDEMFSGVTLSTENYDNLLIGWSQLHLQLNVNFSAGNSINSKESSEAKQYILDTFNWTIEDGVAARNKLVIILVVVGCLGISTFISTITMKKSYRNKKR
jgi:surface protein